MLLRVFCLLFIFHTITSCDQFSSSKNSSKITLDTIVNFSAVDTSPSFKNCDSLFDNQKKADCFRKTIHQKITTLLASHQFTTSKKDTLFDAIYANLLIKSNGKISLETLVSSKGIKKQLPDLDRVLKIYIDSLPKVYPAIKRGIPVTTKYVLPIKIIFKE